MGDKEDEDTVTSRSVCLSFIGCMEQFFASGNMLFAFWRSIQIIHGYGYGYSI